MIKERINLILRLYNALDLLVVSISFILAYFMRKLLGGDSLPPLGPIENYLWLLVVIVPLWGALLHVNHAYSSHRGKAFRATVGEIIKVNLEGFLFLGLFFFTFKLYHINRSLIFIFILTSTLLLILEKLFILKSLKYLRKKGRNIKNILIIGTGERARRFIQNIDHHPETGFRIIGCLGIDPLKIGSLVQGVKILGTSDGLAEILHAEVVDEVIFALPLSKSFLDQIKGYLNICQETGINGRIVADFSNYDDIFSGKMFVDEVVDIPLISFSTKTGKLLHIYLKSIVDFSLSLATLIVLSPLMLVIAIIIKLTSPGPIIFKQERSGLNGRKFTLYKFRTMTKDAEDQKASLNSLNEMAGPVFKITNDPRVTWVGKFLRKTSLDEVFQLVNVLKGDMSLVGPRPLPVYEAVHVKGPNRRRLSMKPGITGPWQINGRNNVSFDQWMKLDLEYIDNWSLVLDFKILLGTIPVVLTGKGAR